MCSASLDCSCEDLSIALPPFSKKTDRYTCIREVASSLFADKGYAGVSLRQLAGCLGMNAGSIYSYIESKQVLLYELIRDHLEGLQDHVEWQVKKNKCVKSKLQSFITAHIEFQLQYRELSILSLLELRSLEPEYRDEITDLYTRYCDYLAIIISDGIKIGLFCPQSLSVVTHGVLGMLSNIVLWFIDDMPLSRGQLISQYTAMVYRSLQQANISLSAQ